MCTQMRKQLFHRLIPRPAGGAYQGYHLSGFIEASAVIRNGSASPELQEARLSLKKQYEKTSIAGINFGEIYADFD